MPYYYFEEVSMKKGVLLGLMILVLLPVGWMAPEMDTPCAGTTYYIRTDGGTSSQCNGQADAPYPGSGSNQPCAWSHPFWALNSGGNWRIQGGDTIIIAPGSYMMGYGAPNTSGWCSKDYTWDCALPPLPSGPDAGHPTRILGKGWNSGCSNPPELWGTQRPWRILSLTGSSNVVIGCLDITDHSSCVEFHAASSVRCERDTYPYGDWASTGIVASDSSNVTLKHLDIHGLALTGIHAGRLSDWSIEDVRIAANGWVGWDGDIDGNDSNSGTITFNRLTIEWNGCGETYPGKQPHNCWAQSAGGYGDGLGTGQTGGHWIFKDSIFRYNTSDGLDLLYTRNPGSQIDIMRTQSYGNAGNPIKVTGNARIENTLMVGNCGFFNGKSFTYHVDNCRAGGNSLALSLRKGDTMSVVNSTIAGQGDCLVEVTCDDSSCNGSELVTMQNNIFLGAAEFGNSSDTTCYIYFDQDNFYKTAFDYNVIYAVKGGEMSMSANDIKQDPMFVNSSLSSFDGHLKSGSPAIDSGLDVGGLGGLIPSDDLERKNRPAGSGVDRGAYEYGATGGGGGINPAPPFGSFDSPANGVTVRSSIAVTGWALDDTGVSKLKLYRGSGNNLVYIGDAVFVEGARPDVASAYPDYPNNQKAGWGYMLLTNFLPGGGNGTFTLHAIATDTSGNSVTLGAKTITCDNANAVKPFGAIDTPTQGGAASGSKFVNFGWVLTPQPNQIPTNGSTIDVWVDGVNIGHPTYNIYRSDIATLFPSYANSGGAIGYFYLDTNAYDNGVHTIQWTATDSGGNTDGIGARYFTIQNNNPRSNPKQSTHISPPAPLKKKNQKEPRIRKGYNPASPLEPLYPAKDGNFYVRIKQNQRLEIHLPPHSTLSPLPVGSHLDKTRRIFYWQPGPAFLGLFKFQVMHSSPLPGTPSMGVGTPRMGAQKLFIRIEN
jgi:hypothetical protein